MGARANPLLFELPPKPRAKPRKLMAVIDAGDNDLPADQIWTRMQCRHCGHEEEGVRPRVTLTELKRGLPCPKCNPHPTRTE